ncbi:MAG: hypothetical protein WBH44_09405 [Proteocatella sp.]
MNKKIAFLVIAYTVLNSFIVIFPQMKENQDLKQQIFDIDKVQEVSSENLTQISALELIGKIDVILKKTNLNQANYTYAKDERETTQAHKIRITLNGSKSSVSSFLKQLIQIEGLQLDELVITQSENELNANMNIIVIGGKYENKIKQ